jgi:hypothetical protein
MCLSCCPSVSLDTFNKYTQGRRSQNRCLLCSVSQSSFSLLSKLVDLHAPPRGFCPPRCTDAKCLLAVRMCISFTLNTPAVALTLPLLVSTLKSQGVSASLSTRRDDGLHSLRPMFISYHILTPPTEISSPVTSILFTAQYLPTQHQYSQPVDSSLTHKSITI